MYSSTCKPTQCVICNGMAHPNICLYDDRYGYPGLFQMVECCDCGHRMLDVDFSAKEITTLYSEYYPRSTFALKNFRPARGAHGFNAWLSGIKRCAYLWVPENVRVLDIGCGFGESLAYHKARGCDVYGVEADENILRVAETFGFNAHAGVFDPDRYAPDFFDYITLDQVIEHMAFPVETLCGIARVLKPGGKVILSTPNASGWGAKLFGRRWINWHAPYHLQHFSFQSMQIAAEKAGLKMERIRTLTSSEWLSYQWIHLLIFPNMGEPSPFWSPNGKRNARTRLITILLAQVNRTRINHVLTRMFDAVGFGDGMLIFLKKV